MAKQSLHSFGIGSYTDEKRRETVAEIMETESSRVVVDHLSSDVAVRRKNPSLYCSWSQMIFDEHVGDPWLLAL
jgi:hypothetical protein